MVQHAVRSLTLCCKSTADFHDTQKKKRYYDVHICQSVIYLPLCLFAVRLFISTYPRSEKSKLRHFVISELDMFELQSGKTRRLCESMSLSGKS